MIGNVQHLVDDRIEYLQIDLQESPALSFSYYSTKLVVSLLLNFRSFGVASPSYYS